jgi:TolB-like protein/DNA-binding winged helix-turn-helix (wHTH) protein/Flp pilus assembly protein TadD
MGDTDRTAAFRLGDWLVQPDLGRISRGDEVVHLRPQLMDLLVFLAQRAGGLASKNDILDGVWPEEFVAESALTRCIAELRQALGDEVQQPRFIETVPKRGYRLLVEAVPVSGAEEALQPSPKSTARRWMLAIAVGAVAVAAVVGGLYLQRSKQPTEPVRIVVLPFKNLGSAEDEDFADGMTSELISRLSVVSGLEVISTTSSMYYKGANRLIGDIGRELDADYALEGEVRWDWPEEGPGRVRITPQLIHIESDAHVWSGLYDRDIASIFDVQFDIAEQVIANLRVRLLERERRAIEAIPTDNMEAYNAYLRGLNRTYLPSRENFGLATAMFQRAVELDPEFALAYAWLSQVRSFGYWLRFDLDPEAMARAKREADRALELDPTLAEGHVALGQFHEFSRDPERALAEYRVALALRPSDAAALVRSAMIQTRRGQWQEPVDLLQRARALNPQAPSVLSYSALTYMGLRRYPEAAEFVDRAIAIAPDRDDLYRYKWLIFYNWHGSPPSIEVPEEVLESAPHLQELFCEGEYERRNYEAALACFARLSSQVTGPAITVMPLAYYESKCYARMGELDLARQKLEEALDFLERVAAVRPEDHTLRSLLGLVYAGMGRREDAIREGERAVALEPVSEDAYLGAQHERILARIYALVGEPEAALDRIEHLLSIPAELSVAVLRHSPTWDPLRDHPRFSEIVERYGGKP